MFLKTAEALKIKGIVDCLEMEEAPSLTSTLNSDEILRRSSTSSSVGDMAAVADVAAAVTMVPRVSSEQPLLPPGSTIIVEASTAASTASSPPPPTSVVMPPQHQHPAGDLSLLATAAASALAAAAAAQQTAVKTVGVPSLVEFGNLERGATVMPPNPKRRKTAPRKLGSFLSSSPAHEPFRLDHAIISCESMQDFNSVASFLKIG